MNTSVKSFLLALALTGCGEADQLTRVRIVAVYQEGDVGWGGGEAKWHTTLEVIASGQRFRRSYKKLGAVGDEFMMRVSARRLEKR